MPLHADTRHYDACVHISELDAVLDRLAGRSDAPERAHDPQTFVAWAAASDPELDGPMPLSRFLAELRAGRPDLLDAYPQIPGIHVADYCEWARVFGREQVPIPAELIPANVRPTIARYDQAGVNLAGFLTAELGIGEVARRLASALRVASVPFATTTFTQTANRTAVEFRADSEARFDTNIVCVNADSWGSFAQRVGPGFFAGRTTIGVWFWETSTFPSMFHSAFSGIDEIWTASSYVADILRASAPSNIPVRELPLPIVAPGRSMRDIRACLNVPGDRQLFVTSFDHNSVADRKNPQGAIRAFQKAFPNGDGPMLLVKSINGDRHPDSSSSIRELTSTRADVMVYDGYLDPADNIALMAQADCIVSLHRAEGFGFNIADAMALGVPVLATAYSGNLAYADADDCWLVAATETLVGPGHFPYESAARWAEPDLESASHLMTAIAADPHGARERANRARTRVLRTFTPERTGAVVRNRIAGLRAERASQQGDGAALLAPSVPPRGRWARALSRYV